MRIIKLIRTIEILIRSTFLFSGRSVQLSWQHWVDSAAAHCVPSGHRNINYFEEKFLVFDFLNCDHLATLIWAASLSVSVTEFDDEIKFVCRRTGINDIHNVYARAWSIGSCDIPIDFGGLCNRQKPPGQVPCLCHYEEQQRSYLLVTTFCTWQQAAPDKLELWLADIYACTPRRFSNVSVNDTLFPTGNSHQSASIRQLPHVFQFCCSLKRFQCQCFLFR